MAWLRLSSVVLPLSFLAGCADDAALSGLEDGDARAIVTGSPEGIGLVAFLNHANTTLAVLDDQVPLDRRAATNLVNHRNGYDGALGTKDDDKYDTVEEVDAVPQIGPAALDALSAYVHANGWVPEGDDPLGTWDGVAFTVDEAEVVVAFVNQASVAELDDDVPLDARAANNVVAARPIATVHQLSSVAYVGNASMSAIKTYAMALAYADGECAPSISPRSNAAATRFNELLELSTMGDWPYSSVAAQQVDGCDDWSGNAEATATMNAALVSSAFGNWDDVPTDVQRVGDWNEGGERFSWMLWRALDAIVDRTDGGSWDPSANVEDAALYAERETLVQLLEAQAAADPTRYQELEVVLDMEECSERAVGRVDLTTGEMLIVHEFPHC